MDLNDSWSFRRALILFAAVVLTVLLVPAGVEAAGPALMRLVDGDGSSKAQVDGGKIRVGDGSGPVTVDGNVGVNGPVNVAEPVTVNGQTGLKPAVLLERGYCGPPTGDDTGQLEVGEVVTAIFLTGSVAQYAGGRLDIYPSNEATPDPNSALMSLKVYTGSNNGGPHNAIYASDSGIRVTGPNPWKIVCGFTISGGGSTGALYSIFGYEA